MRPVVTSATASPREVSAAKEVCGPEKKSPANASSAANRQATARPAHGRRAIDTGSSPESVFTQKRYLNLRTAHGSLALTGDTLTEHRDGQVLTETVDTPEAVRQVVSERFGLDLPDEELGL